jgi:hypothetical protein
VTEAERSDAAPPRWALPIALLVAAVLAVAVVLPAERGVDPTGIGAALGLTEMGRIKQELARGAAAEEAAARAMGSTSARGYAPSPATIAETAGTHPRVR